MAIPHLPTLLYLSYQVTKRGTTWSYTNARKAAYWIDAAAAAFQDLKRTVVKMQAL